MDQHGRAHNMMTSAASLKNYEFDFGNLSTTSGLGAPKKSGGIGGSLSQQKAWGPTTAASQSQAPASGNPVASNFQPMAAPWETAAQKMSAPSGGAVPVALSYNIQASYKEKAPAVGTGGGSSVGTANASTGQSAWRPSYMSSVSPGAPIGKPDPLEGLWSSAAAGAGMGAASGIGSGAAKGAGGGSRASSAGNGSAADPFSDLFSVSGATASMAALKVSGVSGTRANANIAVATDQTATMPAPSLPINRRSGGSTTEQAANTSSSDDTFDPFGNFASAAPAAAPAPADPFAGAFGVASGSNAPSMADPFGDIGVTASSSAGAGNGGVGSPDPFDVFGSSFGKNTGTAQRGEDAFDAFSVGGTQSTSNAPSAASSGNPADGFDAFFGASATGAAAVGSGNNVTSASTAGGGSIPTDDWAAAFGTSAASAVIEEHSAGGTVELEGLPPPPAGLTVSAARDKGEAFYKAGQFADAIKWLLWAEALIGPGAVDAERGQQLAKVLTTRAGCYKEAGEMKKAVADISKVVEIDPANATVLMQRAVLYEGMEKYRRGVEDLREVLKLEPSNRTAMTMLNRLSKLVD